jgi:hypothetical protein
MAMTFAGSQWNRLDSALVQYLEANHDSAEYLVATQTSSYASFLLPPVDLGTRRPRRRPGRNGGSKSLGKRNCTFVPSSVRSSSTIASNSGMQLYQCG